jgi:eukaryotic-like serine/threonine-protein kinase
MRDPFIGARINRYEIRESIHKSDLIGVYKAYDTKLERYVLLKMILHSAEYSEEARNFFLAEARTLAKLDHDNIARVLDFGSEDGNLYLISEYISGNTLSDLMTNPIPWQNAMDILLPITDGLVYAHTKGVIHRDLKPDNILIDVDNQPILSDFSLVRIIEEEETRDMTGTSVGLGSAGYISPEQGQGKTVDYRSDIYSVGVIFYEMVTGKRLFYATSSMEIVIQHIMANPPRPRKIIPDLPKRVEAIILKALSKDPDKRYQSMEELASAMRSALLASKKTRKPLSRRARMMITAFAGAFVLVLVGVALIWLNIPGQGSPVNTLAVQAQLSPTVTAAIVKAPPGGTLPVEPSATKATVPTPAPASAFHFSSLPVLQKTQLPAADAAIDLQNAVNIRELARWGNPDITRLVFINNGNHLLAVTSAGLYYLNAGDLAALHVIDGEGVLTALSVSEDGKWLATGDINGTVAIWEVASGEKRDELPGKGRRILALNFSPNGSSLAFSDVDDNIYIWSPGLDQNYTFEKKHSMDIPKLLFSADGNYIYSGSYDFRIIVWDLNGHFKDKFTTDKRINDIAISPDQQYLAAAMNDSTIQIWNRVTKDVVNSIHVPSLATNFTSIVFLPTGGNFLTASDDGYVRQWSLSGDKPVWETTSIDEKGNPTGATGIKTLALSRDGSQFAVVFDNGMVDIWNLSRRQKDASADWHSSPLQRVAISPDDRTLAYQLGNDSVDVIPIDNNSQSVRVSGTLPRGNPISPDNKITIVQPGRNDQLGLYGLPITSSQQPVTLFDYPPNGIVGFSPDSRMLAAFSNRTLNYWSMSSVLELKADKNRPLKSCQTIYGQDGSFVAAGSENGITFSEANSPYFCQISRNPRQTSEAMLSDGSIVAQPLENQLVDIWDVQNGEEKIEIETLSGGDVRAAAISNDGSLLAVVTESGALEIYNLKARQRLKVLELHTGPINQVLFSNSGKYIITVSSDGTLRLFGLHRQME